MIIRPIIPIWLMTIICVLLIIFIVHSKKLKQISKKEENSDELTDRQKKVKKY